MRYVITTEQYKRLLEVEEMGPEDEEQSGADSSTATPTSSSSNFTYGDVNKIGDDVTKSALTGQVGAEQQGQQANTQPQETNLYTDFAQTSLYAKYPIKGMKKIANNKLEVDFETFKATTDCSKLQKGDYSFDYGQKKYYSKELATQVGEKFSCKLKQ